jgi:hypothetical protein
LRQNARQTSNKTVIGAKLTVTRRAPELTKGMISVHEEQATPERLRHILNCASFFESLHNTTTGKINRL